MTICSHIHRNLQHIIQIKKIKKRDLECSCHLYLCSLGGSSQCNASSAAQRIAGQNNNRSILPSIPINVTGCSRTCWYFWNSAFEIIWMILFFGDIQNVFGSIGTGLPVPMLPNKQWTVNHIYLCVSCLFFFFIWRHLVVLSYLIAPSRPCDIFYFDTVEFFNSYFTVWQQNVITVFL